MARSLLVFLAAVVATHALKVPESGYLLTAPKVLQAGTDERGCISLYNLPGPNRQLKFKFVETSSPHGPLFDATADIPDTVDENGEHCFDVTIPSHIAVTRAKMTVELTAGGDAYQPPKFWKEETTVTLKPEKFLTLVQTDKAKYQPGQKVFVRVVSLDHSLKPLNKDLDEVYITTPDRSRVAQWRNVKTNSGMVQLEMQLIEEPPLGTWKVTVKTSHDRYSKTFVVEEYVLPTFEVKVEAPDTIDSSARTISTKICSKYTFGKPLIGANVSIKATAPGFHHFGSRSDDKFVKELFDFQPSDNEGCAIFDLVVSKLGINANRHSRDRVELAVVVEERGTGLKQEERKTVSQESSFLRLDKIDHSLPSLKPNLPYYGKYKLKAQFGKPVKNEIVKVCYTASFRDRHASKGKIPDDVIYNATKKYNEHVQSVFGYTPMFWEAGGPRDGHTAGECREYTTDDEGSIQYFIPAQSESVDSISISTTTSVGSDSDSDHDNVDAFFSPSNSYLSIDARELPDELPCTGEITFKLLTTEKVPVPYMNYKVMSRGRIMEYGKLSGDSLTLTMKPKMGPEFKLLIFYVKESGEVVSDSRIFPVAKCFPNKVEVSWDKETVKPGDSASFTVKSAPNSVCGISAVDKSTELLGTSNQITLQSVFSRVQQFVISKFESPNQERSDREYCKEVEASLVDTLKSGGATEEELTPKKTDGDSSDHDHFRHRPESYRTVRKDAIKPFDDAGFLVLSNLALETRPCYKRAKVLEKPIQVTSTTTSFGLQNFATAALPPRPQQAFFAAEAPLAADIGSSAGAPAQSQEDQVREFFPEAFLYGIEIVDEYGMKTVTSEMPDTITSWVGSAMCVNGEDGFGVSEKSSITTFKPFFTDVSLPYSVKRGEVLTMSATVFNFMDSSLSVYLEVGASDDYEVQSQAGYDLCVAAGVTEVKNFTMNFFTLGEVNITVSARVKDGNCDEPNTVAPGSDTVIRPLVIKPEGFPQEETRSRFICLDKGDENHVENVELPIPRGLVEGSERSYFSVIGDLLGPSYEGLERGLIRAPTGAGEPNMITLAPNIYIRDYLEDTNQVTELQRRQTNHNMKSGYQRQLKFRRFDGSFSTYGEDDREGSLWLTSFVAQVFNKASKYVDIDQDVIRKASDWVVSKLNPSTYCFEETGQLIHTELKGGTTRGGEAALTAFAMLALKDYASSDVLANGFACLEDGLLLENKTLYSEILITYTYLELGNAAKGKRMVDDLLKKAKREGDDIVYWEGNRTSEFGGSRAVDVEMTSYMVLALLNISGQSYLQEAARAVRWINTQRNSHGGFVSTQDTIIAIQALSQFAIRTFASDLTTPVTVTAGGDTVERIVSADSRLLLQQSKVPDLTLPATVSFEVSPPGCVVVQNIFRYSSTLRVPDPAFSLGVAVKPHSRAGYTLEVCTSFLRDAPGVDRAILEMEMPSGYIPVDSTLRIARKHEAVRNIKSDGGQVVFTLSGIREDKTCIEFRILQENEVDKLKPAVVKVFDFYRPEERNRIEYELTPSPPVPAPAVSSY
uniref:TEP1-F n=1 Tax=Megabalanus coccopoma TaxID=864464 RepID=I7GY22_9CRUS|nr:settlement inducing protein complex [Megabalanus coccopoma]